MGGKNAAVVFDDCDIESCIATLKRSAFINSGQVCTQLSVFLVNILSSLWQKLNLTLLYISRCVCVLHEYLFRDLCMRIS